MVKTGLSLERKLIIDDMVEEINEKFYQLRPTYIKAFLYQQLKSCNAAEYEYLVEKIKESPCLYSVVADIIFEFTYLKPSAQGVEDKICRQKIIMDETGNYKILKLWN